MTARAEHDKSPATTGEQMQATEREARSEHKSLLHRLQSAEAGSRELDAEIMCALTPGAAVDWSPATEVAPGRYWALMQGGQSLRTAPQVSSSVDAALALIEAKLPGAYIELSGPRKYLHIPTPSPNRWLAALMADRRDVLGWGATPALALCIALLSALEQHEKTNG